MTRKLEDALETEVMAQDLERLAERLRLLPGAELIPLGPEPHKRRSPGDDNVELARKIYTMRRVRAQFLPPELFGEPAWDILLDLYIKRAEGRAVSTTSACIASGVPSTTGLRWLAVLEEHDLVERRSAVHDARVTYVGLTRHGVRCLQRHLSAAPSSGDSDGLPFLLREK